MALNAGLIIAILIFGCGFALSRSRPDYLPALHQIQSYTFPHTYSCGGDMSKSSLFLSSFSERLNAPDLFYNGPCGSEPYFDSATAGDDFALISLLGNISLEEVTANAAFTGIGGTYTTFQRSQKAVPSMSYVALLSKSEIRALIAFRITSINNNTGSCDIDYAVLSYSLQGTLFSSPGWDWNARNTYTQAPSGFVATPAGSDEVRVYLPLDSRDGMAIMGSIMGAAILGLLVAVVVLSVKLCRRSGYTKH